MVYCTTFTAINVVGLRIIPVGLEMLKGLESGMERNGTIGIVNIQKMWKILSASTLTGITTGLANNTMKVFITATIMVGEEVGNSLTEAMNKADMASTDVREWWYRDHYSKR